MKEDFAIIQLVLAMLTLALAISAWRRRDGSGRSAPRAAKAPNENLQGFAREFNKVSSQFDELIGKLPKPVESAETCIVSAFLAAYERWSALARKQNLSAVFAKEVRDTAEDIRTSLRKLQALPAGYSDQPYREKIEPELCEAAWQAVSSMDRDIDRGRKKPELQSALRALVGKANLELIDPKPGSWYPPDGSGLAIRVGEVLTRGLRASNGSALHEPEIMESR